MRKVILGSVLVVVGFGMNGCMSYVYDAIDIKSNYSNATIEKAKKVTFKSDRHIPKSCKYLGERTRVGAAYRMTEAQNSARRYLMLDAAQMGGNVVAVTDKMITKNKMTKNIELTASIYRCR